MQEIGFDIINDLNLDPNESFNWENKASSLYCLVAGNISSNLRTVLQTLAHLSTQYHGVFFVPGTLEYEGVQDIFARTEELITLSESIPNVCMLHQNVVIIDGVAILGTNGWSNIGAEISRDNMFRTAARYEDITYLTRSIDKLQRHLDVRKIVVVTSAVPKLELYFGEEPENEKNQIPLSDALTSDTERKVHHWVFGSYNKSTDTYIENINYINNPYVRGSPYWAKRLTILI